MGFFFYKTKFANVIVQHDFKTQQIISTFLSFEKKIITTLRVIDVFVLFRTNI